MSQGSLCTALGVLVEKFVRFPRDAAHFVAEVKPDVVKGLAFAVNRYDDRGLKTHTRYYYAIRTVHKNGEKGEFHAFSGLTRDRPKGVITREKQ